MTGYPASNNVFIPADQYQNLQPTLEFATGDHLGLVIERQGLMIGYRRVQSQSEWDRAVETDRKWRREENLPPVEYPVYIHRPYPINRYVSITPQTVT